MPAGSARADGDGRAGAPSGAHPKGHTLKGTGRQASGLAPFRARLDELDEQIARLFGERFDVCRAVAQHKSEHEIPMMQPERVAQVRARYLRRGEQVGLPADFTESLFDLLIGATCKLEDELMAGATRSDATGTGNSATVGDGSSRR
jgi:chorismate mutase